ncbi:MAG TPA: type II toxin-antitoxin system VapC family toxin [Urbifossiella sp.]|nr:type II toxin-antitoxin system VapC family toxin [Urbifossiella sp.]
MREAFELYVSELVLEECEAGDPAAAADRLAVLAGIPILVESPAVGELTDLLIRGGPLPPKAAADAAHIATAAVHGMHYLLTWNCTHIANAVLRPRIDEACRSLGYAPPLICTTDQLRPVEDGT